MTAALGRSLVWSALYAAAVVAGRLTALPETGLALFWPAAGVAVLWVLQTSAGPLLARLSMLFSVTVVVNQLVGVTFTTSLVFGLANLAVALSAWAVLAGRRGQGLLVRPDETMASTRGVIALAVASTLGGVVSAPLGVLAGLQITGQASTLGAVAWAVRNATGVFVVAGVVLAVQAARHRRRPGTPWTRALTNEGRPHAVAEVAVTAVVVAAILELVFGYSQGLPLAYALVAVSAFVGFRFSPVVAAVATTAAGTFSIVATALGRGPFEAVGDPVASALVVQAFVLVQAAIALTLSWAVAERHTLAVDLEAAREEADERAQLLDAVTDRLAHGVAVIDRDGRVLVRNRAAAALVPGPSEQVTEDDQPERYGVFRVDGQPMGLSSMPHTVALEQGESISAALMVRRPTSDDRYVKVRAEPLELTGAHPRRVAVVSMQDDTDHHRRVEELETFAGTIAHDLRNPLAAMTNWVHVLSDHLEDQATRDAGAAEALGRIAAAGERMSRLIEDLLAYATASSAPLRRSRIDLDQLVGSMALEIAAASSRSPVITTNGLGTLDADAVLVRQLFANLLGNAVKYTADDVRPTIHVSAERTPVGTVVRVVDNGVGIPADMRLAVLEGFTRVAGTAQDRPGAGLGLAICARAVERHGGTIEIGPGPRDTGSTVTVTFPHAAPVEPS